MNNLIVKHSQQVTATIKGTPATSVRYRFDDIPNLSRNNIVLYGISVYGAAQLAKTVGGKTVLADADLDKVVVTLKDNDNYEFMYQMPSNDLVRSKNAGIFMLVEPRIINLTDCYIQLTDTTGIAEDEVLLMNFFYDFVG